MRADERWQVAGPPRRRTARLADFARAGVTRAEARGHRSSRASGALVAPTRLAPDLHVLSLGA